MGNDDDDEESEYRELSNYREKLNLDKYAHLKIGDDLESECKLNDEEIIDFLELKYKKDDKIDNITDSEIEEDTSFTISKGRLCKLYLIPEI